jgi:hypothetical protein
MATLSPNEVIKGLAELLDDETRRNIIIVGSLAAAYHFPTPEGERRVATKDSDAMVSPHIAAVRKAQELTDKLLANGWTLRPDPKWGRPGGPDDPTQQLPLVRLNPPGVQDWFIELLAAPDENQPPKLERQYHRIETALGHFCLISFGYLGLVQHDAAMSPYGVRVATPAMMALANMLHHPKVGPELIAGLRQDNPIRRSNKDIGRVVALATLGGEAEYSSWAAKWWDALNTMYPDQAVDLALRAGNGLREMLERADFVEQALYTCNVGLLAGMNIGQAAFSAMGRTVVFDAIDALEDLAQQDRQADSKARPKG